MCKRGPARKTLEEACDAQTREDISMSWRARHTRVPPALSSPKLLTWQVLGREARLCMSNKLPGDGLGTPPGESLASWDCTPFRRTGSEVKAGWE